MGTAGVKKLSGRWACGGRGVSGTEVVKDSVEQNHASHLLVGKSGRVWEESVVLSLHLCSAGCMC